MLTAQNRKSDFLAATAGRQNEISTEEGIKDK
jgi:hypothetical protein